MKIEIVNFFIYKQNQRQKKSSQDLAARGPNNKQFVEEERIKTFFQAGRLA